MGRHWPPPRTCPATSAPAGADQAGGAVYVFSGMPTSTSTPPPPTAPATTASISPPATTSCIWDRSAQATDSSGTAAAVTGTPPPRSRSAGPRPRTSPCRHRPAPRTCPAHLHRRRSHQAGGVVYVFSADAYVYVGATTADGSGDYTIDLAPGDYKLYLGPVSAGYGLQWYGGSGTGTPPLRSRSAGPRPRTSPCRHRPRLEPVRPLHRRRSRPGRWCGLRVQARMPTSTWRHHRRRLRRLQHRSRPRRLQAVSGTGQRRLRAPVVRRQR